MSSVSGGSLLGMEEGRERLTPEKTFLALVTSGDLVCEDNWGRSQRSWETHRDWVLSPLSVWVEKPVQNAVFFFLHFTTTFRLWGQAVTVCMLRSCAGFGAKPWISSDAQDGISFSLLRVKEGEMLLLLYRGYTHLSAPLWLTTQNVFSTRLWFNCYVCTCECMSVCVWECEERMIIHLEHFHWMHYCIFFKIVLENYRWNYYDWEIHLFLFWWRVTWPYLCFVGLIIQPVESCQFGIRLFLGAKMSIVLQRYIMKCKYRITNSY